MYTIGIDLGGTSIKAGLCDEALNIIDKDTAPTLPHRKGEEIVADMAELGYINEQRQVMRLALREAEKLRGPRRITAALSAKGYSSADIHRAIRELCDSGEVDFEAMKSRLVEARLGDSADEEEIKKLLYKAGF